MNYNFKDKELVISFYKSKALECLLELARINECKYYLYLERFGEVAFSFDNTKYIMYRKGVMASRLVKALV